METWKVIPDENGWIKQIILMVDDKPIKVATYLSEKKGETIISIRQEEKENK